MQKENNIKPDFEKAYLLANEILVSSHVIKTFPFSAAALLKEQTDISLHTYSYAITNGVSANDLAVSRLC